MQDGHVNNKEPIHRSSREAFRDLFPKPWQQNYPETKGNCEVQRVCDLKPGIGHDMPVLSVSGCQHGENLGDDSIGPAPQRPVVEERHQLELVREHSQHRPEQMRNEQCPSDVGEKVRAVPFKAADIEVAILPVHMQWLSQPEEETIQRIVWLLPDLLHHLLLKLMLLPQLVPVNLLLDFLVVLAALHL